MTREHSRILDAVYSNNVKILASKQANYITILEDFGHKTIKHSKSKFRKYKYFHILITLKRYAKSTKLF